MSRELLLLRHAKSSWDSPLLDDFSRPLNKRGIRDAGNMGTYLQNQSTIPDAIVCSPATRAKQTLEHLLLKLTIPNAKIFWKHQLYLADLSSLLATLATFSARRLLVIGHNPGLEELICFLAPTLSSVPPEKKLLPTSSLAYFKMPESWRELQSGDGQLVSLIKPKSLL